MKKLIPFAILTGIILIFVIANFPFGTVGTGERGVRLRFSAVTGDIVREGLYFRIPFIERVVKMDVKIQKEQVEAGAASKDLQTVHSTVALNYHLDPSRVVDIYRDIGTSFNSRLIDPALQESVKESTAKFTAEELITKRDTVGLAIRSSLKAKLEPRGILVDDFNIVNFEFSTAFNESIERKVSAEQDAFAARNRLEKVKFEAEQNIAEARGKAEAIRLESEALKVNSQILQSRAIEKWDGKLPQVTNGGTPFISIDLKPAQP